MDKFNEYEQRQVKNFILLENRDDTASKLKRETPQKMRKPLTVQKKSGRVRSAERDKRTEFHARYWAFLFGNLQRAIDEIYRIVEYYENIDSCQEAILVLENYTREFRALSDFFKMSSTWEYDKTPQRPHSVAWEVRKTSAVPRIRNRNLTSPGLSGKSSPSYSGTNSPCPTIDELKPTEQPQNVKNYSNAGASSKTVDKSELPAVVVELMPAETNITANERKFEQILKETSAEENFQLLHNTKPKSISLENLNQDSDDHSKEYYIQSFISKGDAASQTEGIIDDHLTLQEYLLKYCSAQEEIKVDDTVISEEKAPIVAETLVVEKEPIKEESSKQLSLSQIIVKPPQEKTTIPPAVAPKTVVKAPIKANYSLRNQTISSKNPKTIESHAARKPSNVSHTRQSRTTTRTNANIPSTSSADATRNKQWEKSYLGARSKTMIELPKNQPRMNRAGELRKKKSTEDNNNTDSSSSTLKASNEKLGSKGSLKNASGDLRKNSSTKRIDIKTGNSGDGEWTMVKTKRRSSWASHRFDQPSASASLPALAFLNENCDDSDKEQSKDEKVSENSRANAVGKMKLKSAVEQKKEVVKPKSAPIAKASALKSKVVAPVVNNNKKLTSVKAKVNSNAPKRVTLAVDKPNMPLANKQNEGNQQNQQAQNMKITRQKSDITGLKIKSLHKEYLRSEKSAGPLKKKKESSNDQKVDMNLQTSQILISETIDELYSEEMGKKHSKLPNGSLSSCDEIEESDDDQKKLLEEQENLERQIRELENCDIDEIDTETDETDCEAILCELDEGSNDTDSVKDPLFINDNMTLEMRYAPILGEMSVNEREETLATLQTLLARDPGRAQKLHQKLSSPSRRRSVRETLKKYQAKHTRAQEKRSTIQKERSHKIQQLIQRVEQVKAAQELLIENRRLKMEVKLQRATENRENFLKNKVRKAHDEEEKLKEIAFIKDLEMQNKKLDFMESCKEQEFRLSSMEQERQKRQLEKLAKEAAVERRRSEIELERIKKLEKMDETRKKREQRVEKIQEEKEKLRLELVKEKQRNRDERLQAMQQQQLQDTEELQRKITKKQEEYQKRYEENIEHIRQRAYELAQQRNIDDSKSQNDEEENLENIERTRESIKNAKKKMKKIRERFAVSTQTYLEELPELAVNHRKQSQIPKLLNAIKRGNGSVNNQLGIERPIGQIIRQIEKCAVVDFHCLWLLDGLGTLATVIEDGIKPNSDISRVALTKAIQLYRNSCSSCKQIAQHSILAGSFLKLIDALSFILKNPDFEVKTPTCPVEVSTELLLVLTVVLSNLKANENAAVEQRIPDLLSYLTASGVLELITKRCLKVREPIENQQQLLLPLLAMIGFVTKIVEICPRDKIDFLSLIKSTEIFGTISLLYKTMSFGETIPRHTISLAGSAYGLIKAVVLLDVTSFQQILKEERLTFKFLDVVTILLNYCGPKLSESEDKEMKAVIRDLVIIIGYFCANNRRNQNLLTSEQSCIILKSITKLPIELGPVYYPTLLTIFWENSEAEAKLSKEFDIQLLKEYERSSLAKSNPLLQMLEI